MNAAMNEYIWHLENTRGEWLAVIVLAWHEGRATVIELDSEEQVRDGASPFLVSLSDLCLGRPPEPLAVPA